MVRAALRRLAGTLAAIACDPLLTLVILICLGAYLMSGQPWEGWE